MITENKNNYYEILEVPVTANQHDIFVAYQKAKETYSESNQKLLQNFSVDEIKDLAHLVDEAFSVLSHQEFRTVYEQRINSKSFSASNISFDAIKEAVTDAAAISSVEKMIQRQSNTSTATTIDKNITFIEDGTFENEILNQTEWSGSFLKKVREYKNMSIDELHQKTKVNPWYLNAIETMDFNNLPVAVFVRGYIVQIAKELSLDQKKVSDSYMKIYKKKIES